MESDKDILLPPWPEENKSRWIIPPIVLSGIILGILLLGGLYLGYRDAVSRCGYTSKDLILGVSSGMWRECWER